MDYPINTPVPGSTNIGVAMREDPRALMALRLPRVVQPLLTWLTARPAPGEPNGAKKITATAYVWGALALAVVGVVLSAATAFLLLRCAGFTLDGRLALISLLGVGLLLTTSGLGLFQVVVFHHCAHGTVFRSRERNRNVGRLVSSLLLFKHFDHYQKEHMLHHNANKLFTDDDEFTDFVVGICALAPSMSHRQLWRRLLVSLVSPWFHGRFLYKRMLGSLNSHDRLHNSVGLGFLGALGLGGVLAHALVIVLIAWVLPLTVLLQIATVFRILCEHRMPPAQVIAARGKVFVCQATAGVFPGAAPPDARAGSLAGLAAWTLWWADMLTVQLFVRVFVLVGDAPCHDFHHRRPASKRWPNYIHARQDDADAGCPGFPLNYIESWGLFRAIDENLRAMSQVGCAADYSDDYDAVYDAEPNFSPSGHGLREREPIERGLSGFARPQSARCPVAA
jgi:fatty acid desaturase